MPNLITKITDSKEQIKKFEKVKNLLKKQESELQKVKSKQTGEIEILYKSKQNRQSSLELSYHVYRCGWSPLYNMRASNIGEPIKFEYNAQVFQNTGVNWKNCKLTIATGNPILGGNKPDLYTWSIGEHTFSNLDDYKNKLRAKGDYMGVASRLNDAADITAPVRSYWPNDYGLYQMAGNVSEWVMDVYRPLTLEDANEFRSFRGNVYETYAKDADGYYLDKDSLGKMQMRPIDIKNPEDELEKRRNYKKSQNIDFLDGEFSSSVYYDDPGMAEPAKANRLMYETATHSLQSNRTRVYKGGNWKDRVYWMAPGTRRFLDEDQDQDNLGFRCAMHRVGKPTTWE